MTTRLQAEVVDLLQALIRVNTVNPPGNETAAAEVLRDYLAENAIPCDLIAKTPGRANLVARRPGGGDGDRSLALICHTDTVLADPAEWSRDPFSGDVTDGEVWGRGALDMKGHAAAAAVAFASLVREGFRPAGDLILAATADEEVNAGYGLSWLCSEHPDTVRCRYAVNEGGGERFECGGRAFYLCGAAEKMLAPFKLVVQGRSGHASRPSSADNALVRAARLIARLAEYEPEPELTVEVAAFLQAVVGHVPAAEDALAQARAAGDRAAEVVEPLLSLTTSPTMISASRKQNVVPALCEVTCDCRLPAGWTSGRAEPVLRSVLGADGYRFEWLDGLGGTRSPLGTPLWQAIEAFVSEVEPGAAVVPTSSAGATDSHWLRRAFGTVAYGFFPYRSMPADVIARLVHSGDERIAIADLELGVRFFRHVARAVSTP